jgi:hypothetical protein
MTDRDRVRRIVITRCPELSAADLAAAFGRPAPLRTSLQTSSRPSLRTP